MQSIVNYTWEIFRYEIFEIITHWSHIHSSKYFDSLLLISHLFFKIFEFIIHQSHLLFTFKSLILIYTTLLINNIEVSIIFVNKFIAYAFFEAQWYLLPIVLVFSLNELVNWHVAINILEVIFLLYLGSHISSLCDSINSNANPILITNTREKHLFLNNLF